MTPHQALFSLSLVLVIACGGSSPTDSPDTAPPGADAQPIEDATPLPTGGIAELFTKEAFDSFFPHANGGVGPDGEPYNYANFLRAAAEFPAFGNTGDTETRLREIAALLGHVVQETATSSPTIPRPEGGLFFLQELGCESGCPAYSNSCTPPDLASQGVAGARANWPGWAYPCSASASYHGRGAHQLSYNYNYGLFSRYMFDGDATVLLNDPDRLLRDGRLAFLSAIWFWMTPRSPKPSMHAVITGSWTPAPEDVAAGILPGFGATINIINPIECGGPIEDARAQGRIDAYERLCNLLGVSPRDNLGCATMAPFSVQRDDIPAFYLEQDWAGGCTCNPVTYETPFLAGIPGDAERCADSMRVANQPPFFLEAACTGG